MNTINPQNLLIKIAAILERLNIDYVVTGGMAISVWGRPRATFDIDVVIEISELEIQSLIQALHDLSQAGYVDEDAAKEAIRQKGEFNFIDSDTGLKVDFWVTSDDEFSRLKFQRKRLKVIKGQKVYFVSPEDLIVSKLLWYKMSESTRQLEDVQSVLRISGSELDMQYLMRWAEKLGVSLNLKKLLSKGKEV